MSIDDEDLKEYIVTIHKMEDLESFYDDMETPGGTLYIPNRIVDLAYRFPTSPNTHYYLTYQEAAQLRLDPRVRAVTRPLSQIDMVKRYPLWTHQSSNWYKGGPSDDGTSSIQSLDKNWGLLRCVEGNNRLNWGRDGTVRTSGTAYTDANGKNVDVVICDGLFRQNHAEFAKQPDGTGGFRTVQYNWFQWSSKLGLPTRPNYSYATNIINANYDTSNHGAHVAGIACGITQGWAREANIYNIGAFGENLENILDPKVEIDPDVVWKYILEFHNSKPTPKIPTVVNYSVGISLKIPLLWVKSINYRNRIYKSQQWAREGMLTGTLMGTKVDPYFWQLGLPLGAIEDEGELLLEIPILNPPAVADVELCINNGIHVVIAGGNDAISIDLPGPSPGPDYNNYIEWQNKSSVYMELPDGTLLAPYSTALTYYCRPHGCQTRKAIVVGSLDSTVTTMIAPISARGPGIDIFAPGHGIMSAISAQTKSQATSSSNSVSDPRDKNSDRLDSYMGTSMAAPQVTGILACFLEKNPNLSPNDMKISIIGKAKDGQIVNKTGPTRQEILYNMQNAPNKYLFYGVQSPPSSSTTSTTTSSTSTSTSTTSSTSTSTSTSTTTTTTRRPEFNLTAYPGTNISEGDTVQICLNVNPNLIPDGTKIPFTYNINPL